MGLFTKKKPAPAVDPLQAAKLQADGALSLFRSTLGTLDSSSATLDDVRLAAEDEIAALTARAQEALAAKRENDKVAANLRKILG